MKENEWISIDDALPKLGQDVLIKSLTRWNGEYTAQLNKESFCGTDVLIFRGGIWVYMPTHWRYPVEKQPDFSKLNSGDMINIEYIDDSSRNMIVIGYFIDINSQEDEPDFIDISPYKHMEGADGAYIELPSITKITRINLEEKTFEEI